MNEPENRGWMIVLAAVSPAILWVPLMLAIPPSEQNFPLHDDALFSRTALVFARGDGFDYFNWASMPMFGQILWASPFVWIFGPTQFSLRLATMTLACLGLAAFADLLRRECGWSRGRTALATACLGLNPCFFLLATTFHTDVPALAFALIALALYARGCWLAGALVAVLAITTRQNAVAAPLAMAWLMLRQPRRGGLLPWLAVLVPVGIGAVVHVAFQARTDIWRVGPQPATLLTVPVLSFIAVHLLGLAALPLLTWPGRREWPALGMALVAMLGFAWVVSVASGRSGGVFPYLGNWITPFGSFDENSIQPGTRPLMAGWNVRLVLTLVGCLCGAILLTRLVAWRREGTPGSLLAALTLFHLPFLAIAPAVYDRYFLVLLPGTLALCASEDRHPGWGVPALVVSGLLSLGLAHDLLAWNRAVWRLGQRAVASGIAPEFIEGGFTWNGWHAPAAARDKTPRPPAGLALPFTRRFFPTVVGRYAISFSSLPGTRVLDRESYRLWMIPGEQQMVFLEAEP